MSMADVINFNKQLKEFYGAESLQKVIIAQADHVEELQATIHKAAEKVSEITEELEDISNGQLAKFYGTSTINGLVEAQAAHIIKLQDKLLQHMKYVDINVNVRY